MGDKSQARKSKTVKATVQPATMPQPYTGISLEKRFELIREQIKHEDELINQRLNWLLLSQGFLFAAFTAIITADKTQIIVNPNTLHWIIAGIPVTGLAFNLFSFFGLDAAYRSLKYLRLNWIKYQPSSNQDQAYYESFPQVTWQKPAITTASGTPIIISAVWLLICIAVNTIVWLNWAIGIFFGCWLVWMFLSTILNQKTN